MQTVKNALIEIWTKKLLDRFLNGFLTYERQLQAELYRLLKNDLSDEYEIWIEPVIYLPEHNLNKVKPDIFITKGDTVIAIIELKFKPWEEPEYKADIEKLIRFDFASDKNLTLILGYKPTSSEWKRQAISPTMSYKLTQDHINCFIVYGKPGSEAIEHMESRPKNFLHLTGWIDGNGGAEFQWFEY